MTDTKKVTELSEITPTFSGLGLTMKVSMNNIKLTNWKSTTNSVKTSVTCTCD